MDFVGDIMTFWERLKSLMDEKQITAKQITQELHISKNSFTYWKQNGNIPRGDILEALANYFECSIDYLLCKTDIKKEQTALNEQPVSEEYKKLIELSSTLSEDEIRQVRQYVEFLNSQHK